VDESDLDRLGITVCSVSGIHFGAYMKLLRPSGLGIPFAVATDGDTKDGGRALGAERAMALLPLLVKPEELIGKKKNALQELARQNGLYVGEHTLEVDLFRAGHHEGVAETVIELASSQAAKQRAENWKRAPGTVDADQLLKDISEIGKGRFAQRLAARITRAACPAYLRDAVQHVASRCS